VSRLLGGTYAALGVIVIFLVVPALVGKTDGIHASLLIFFPGLLAGSYAGGEIRNDFLGRVKSLPASVQWLAVVLGAVGWLIVVLFLAAVAAQLWELARVTLFPGVERWNGWLFWVSLFACLGLTALAGKAARALLARR